MVAGSTAYDDVLIPTDGSPRAERAIGHGLALAEQADATVHAMYVVDGRRYGEQSAHRTYELAVEQLEDEGEVLTDDLAARARDRDLDATTIVTRGQPYEEIVEYATEEDVDLVVMGRSGAGGAENPDIGSVAARVLRTTDIPVFPV